MYVKHTIRQNISILFSVMHTNPPELQVIA